MLVTIMALIFIICSSTTGLFAGIQMLFVAGMYAQLVLLVVWWMVVLAGVKALALKRRTLTFPLSNTAIFLYCLYFLTWVAACILFMISMDQTGSSACSMVAFFFIHLVSGLWSAVVFFIRMKITEKKTERQASGYANPTTKEAETNVNDTKTGQTTDAEGASSAKEGNNQASSQGESPEDKQKHKLEKTQEIAVAVDREGAENNFNGTKTEQEEDMAKKRDKEEECLAKLLALPNSKWCHVTRSVQFCVVLLIMVVSPLCSSILHTMCIHQRATVTA